MIYLIIALEAELDDRSSWRWNAVNGPGTPPQRQRKGGKTDQQHHTAGERKRNRPAM